MSRHLTTTSAEYAVLSASTIGVFNVVSYGAKGNGVADDYPAFSSTISAAYAWASATSAAAQASGASANIIQGATILIPAGWYKLGNTIDWTAGDYLGTGSPSGDGMGRLSVLGHGRYRTNLSFSMGTGSDGMIVGAYTRLADMGVLGAVRNVVVAHSMSGGSNFPGRSAERFRMDRMFLRSAVASHSVDFPAAFFWQADHCQFLGGIRSITANTNGTGHNSYDALLTNCEIATTSNYNYLTTPAIEWRGEGLTVIGCLIYNTLTCSAPTVLCTNGNITLFSNDFRYSGVNSSGAYDIVLGTASGTDSVTPYIQGNAFANKTGSVPGQMGNIWIRSGTQGGMIQGNNWRDVTNPQIHVETGSFGTIIMESALTGGNVVFISSSMDAYSGSVILKDKHNLDKVYGSLAAPLTTVSSTLSAVSSSVSGIFNSSSVSTPTAIYIKSPGGGIYQFTIDNAGVLSSTLV